jgi:hypothetical protein
MLNCDDQGPTSVFSFTLPDGRDVRIEVAGLDRDEMETLLLKGFEASGITLRGVRRMISV